MIYICSLLILKTTFNFIKKKLVQVVLEPKFSMTMLYHGFAVALMTESTRGPEAQSLPLPKPVVAIPTTTATFAEMCSLFFSERYKLF